MPRQIRRQDARYEVRGFIQYDFDEEIQPRLYETNSLRSARTRKRSIESEGGHALILDRRIQTYLSDDA